MSRVETTERTDARDAIDMAPVVTEGGLRVVLRGEVEERWLGGPATVSDATGMTVVTRPLSGAGRAEVATAIGQRLRLHGPGGSCVARVTGAVALARLDAGGELEDTGPQSAWDAAGGGVIAGDLEPIAGRCDEAQWARSESLPQPSMARAAEATSKMRDTAISALKARPEYRELTDGTGSEEHRVVTLSTGGETVVVTTLVTEGCTGPWPTLTALWRVEGGRLAFLGTQDLVTAVLIGADADGDGAIELLVQDDLLGVALLRRDGGRYEVEQRAPVEVLGCRC